MIQVGSVCMCSNSRLGIVTKTYSPKGCMCKSCQSIPTVKGIGFDGKPWQSAKPVLIANNIEEYLTILENNNACTKMHKER